MHGKSPKSANHRLENVGEAPRVVSREFLGYAELHCLSNFTFLRGASHPEELVERAVVLGYRALALTDECSLAGVVRAHILPAKPDFVC